MYGKDNTIDSSLEKAKVFNRTINPFFKFSPLSPLHFTFFFLSREICLKQSSFWRVDFLFEGHMQSTKAKSFHRKD